MDNGSEFKNFGFLSWCRRHGIGYSRSRSYHKNDNRFVRQRTSPQSAHMSGIAGNYAIEDLYWHLERLLNLYYPSVKLLSKERIGIRTVKIR